MIHAIIFICSLSTECMFVSDAWGPYNTIDRCLSRTVRMHKDATMILPKYRSISSHCTTTKFMTKGKHA